MSERTLSGAFAQGRTALVAYLTAGFPDVDTSARALRVAAEHADILELGIPFSDPVADGPAIQRASARAIAGGMTVGGVFELLDRVQPDVPVVLFGYANPVMRFGVATFCTAAAKRRVAGVLLVDVPAGADATIETALHVAGIPMIRLVAPTTDDARLDEITCGAAGFLYLVSRTGVTGTDAAPGSVGLADIRSRIRQRTDLPVVSGFGVRSGTDARALGADFDGVAVGSALINVLDRKGVDGLKALLLDLRGSLEMSPA